MVNLTCLGKFYISYFLHDNIISTDTFRYDSASVLPLGAVTAKC